MNFDMTQEDMKKIDKMLRAIEDPFGTGYPRLKKIRQEMAMKHGMSEMELYQLFSAWKASQN